MASRRDKVVPAVRSPAWLQLRGDDVYLDIVVSPRGSRTRIMGVHDERLKIQLAAPPVDGQANEELVRFVAGALGIAKAQVDIVAGHASKRKTMRLLGVPVHLVVLKLTP